MKSMIKSIFLAFAVLLAAGSLTPARRGTSGKGQIGLMHNSLPPVGSRFRGNDVAPWG